ncbi:MAG: DUF6089 family protein [Saprospiraceae bacterium]
MKHLFLPLFLCYVCGLSAQTKYKPDDRYWEAGILLGAANYSGDLAEKDIHLSETRLGYGGFIRYFLTKHYAIKAHLYACSISGDDANAKDPLVRRRSVRFDANILELGFSGEWHIFGKERYSNTGIHQHFVSPFLFLGVGGVLNAVNPEYYGSPQDRDKFLALPVPEKGKQQQFITTQMGVGVRMKLNERLVIGAEAGVRPMFSDLLDGVSINGNPDKNDWYYLGGVSLSFILNKPDDL